MMTLASLLMLEESVGDFGSNKPKGTNNMDSPNLSVNPHFSAECEEEAHQRKIPSMHSKECHLCHARYDVLVRCQIDDSRCWYFVCTKTCWKAVSGGVVDGDSKHPHYKYGGMWKNKHEAVSAKKPKREKAKPVVDWQSEDVQYVTGDKVHHMDGTWRCQRSHRSDKPRAPGFGSTYWKEIG